MNAPFKLDPGSRVTVVDDDEIWREELSDTLRDFQFEPAIVDGSFEDRIDDLIFEIQNQNPTFVICDNRLQTGQMAQFYGSTVVERLVANKHPAMLLTTFGSPDRIRLRQSRFDIPVVVQRDSFQAEQLGQYFEICLREINSDPVDERKPHRSLIRIESISNDRVPYVDVIIPSWRPEHAVQIPLESIAPSIQSRIEVGGYLLGEVNIGAKLEDDLYFHNVNEFIAEPEDDRR